MMHQSNSDIRAGTQSVQMSRVSGGEHCRQIDSLAVEEPLEIRLGLITDGVRSRRSISITMRTPGHDDELAVGFLHGEGILTDRSTLARVGRCPMAVQPDNPREGGANIIQVDLTADAQVDLARLERHFYTTSSCGVCGKTSLEALALQGMPVATEPTPTIHRSVLLSLPDRLRQAQSVFSHTGGLHAAALFSTDGTLHVLREDVGRHNALDKVIGRAWLDGQLPAKEQVLLVSGRTSFELMQKALAAGIRIVAAVSAPSSLAVDLAQAHGLTLIGFLRGDRFNIYSRPDRVLGLSAP